MCKLWIRTILALSCANLGSSLRAIILGLHKETLYVVPSRQASLLAVASHRHKPSLHLFSVFVCMYVHTLCAGSWSCFVSELDGATFVSPLTLLSSSSPSSGMTLATPPPLPQVYPWPRPLGGGRAESASSVPPFGQGHSSCHIPDTREHTLHY